MSQLLHFPQAARTLKQVAEVTCNKPNEIENYVQLLAKANNKLPDETLPRCSPIILPNNNGQSIGDVKVPLRCSPAEHQRIATLTQSIGGPVTLVLSDLIWEITKDTSPTRRQ